MELVGETSPDFVIHKATVPCCQQSEKQMALEGERPWKGKERQDEREKRSAESSSSR